jgi:hypothetical protein
MDRQAIDHQLKTLVPLSSASTDGRQILVLLHAGDSAEGNFVQY